MKPRGRSTLAVAAATSHRSRTERPTETEKLILAHLELVERHTRSIRRLLRPGIDCDDIAAAGRLRLVEAARDYNPHKSQEPRRVCSAFAGYVCKGVRGAMWDQARRRNWKEASHQRIGRRVIEMPDVEANPQALVERRERRELLDDAMAVLDARERYVVTAYYHEEGDLTGIGRELGVDRKQASRIHRRALIKMQAYMQTLGLWYPAVA